MKVQEVMTKQTAFCGLDMSLADVAQIMQRNHCGFLPTVGEGGNVIGVITDRDVCMALGKRNEAPSEVFVREVIIPPDRTFPKLFACTPDDKIHCVLKTMRESRIRRMPVIDREGALIGVLSIDDLVMWACQYADKEGISCRDVVEVYKAICRPSKRRAAA